MTDTFLAVTLAAVVLAGLLALIVVAVVQVTRRYRTCPPVMAGWIVAVALFPILGPIAWFVWDRWLRQPASKWAREHAKSF